MLLLLIVIVGIPVAVTQLQKQQDIRQRASGDNTVTLAISPTTLPNTSNSFTADLHINTNGNTLTAMQITLETTGDVTLEDFAVTASGFTLASKEIDAAKKKMQIVVYSENATFTGPKLGTITFGTTGESSGSVSFALISGDGGTLFTALNADNTTVEPEISNTTTTLATYTAPPVVPTATLVPPTDTPIPNSPTPLPTATPIISPTGTIVVPTDTPSPPVATTIPTATPTNAPAPTNCIKPKSQGNADGDCFINIADYDIWKNTFGSTGDLRADFNDNGKIDLLDFNIWRNNAFGL